MADIVLVSLGSTAGLWAADEELASSLGRAGVSVAIARTAPQADVRTLMRTDLHWARAAREAATAVIEVEQPAAVIYSTITAALLWPMRGAIRFDALSAANRPGRHGLWQRPLERKRLRDAPLLLPWNAGSLDGCPPDRGPAVAVPVPVEASGPLDGPRDIDAITYATNPHKKGLDRVLNAWALTRRGDEQLLVAGVEEIAPQEGVRALGMLQRDEYRALLRRARVYITAPRREDYGIAQLEALADGCMLVTTAAPGPYVALEIARSLDPRLVGTDLTRAIRAALDTPLDDYAQQAEQAMRTFSRAQIDERVRELVLPRLIARA